MPFSLLQAAVSIGDSHAIEAIAVGAVVGLGRVWNHVVGKRIDRDRARRFDKIEKMIGDMSDDVKDLRAYVVGPDGENGLRGDVREVKNRLSGLEDRERDRLQDDRLHGPYRKN